MRRNGTAEQGGTKRRAKRGGTTGTVPHVVPLCKSRWESKMREKRNSGTRAKEKPPIPPCVRAARRPPHASRERPLAEQFRERLA